MTTPETIKADNGKGFLTQAFAELLDEIQGQDSGTLTLTRGDGGALALLTTDPRMIEVIEGLVELATPQGEEADNV